MREMLSQQRERIAQASEDQVLQFIEDSRHKIQDLQSQITVLSGLLGNERALCAALQHLIAPIRTLPVELLATIFLFSLRDGESDMRNAKKNLRISDAYRVSHVCSEWHQVALATPKLWIAPIQLTYSPEHSRKVLRALFARSAPLPLSISITPNFTGTPIDIPILNEVALVAGRCRSLRCSTHIPASFLQQLGNTDALEELEIQAIYEDVPGFDLGSVVCFSQAPRLQKLSINPLLGLSISMPWAQLTDLTFIVTSNRFVYDPLEILTRCKNLVRTHLVAPCDNPSVSSSLVVLSHLRSLCLRIAMRSPPHATVLFLYHLTAPVLDELHLVFPSNSTWDESPITAFQLRSPSITTLKISGYTSDMSFEAVKAALLNAPLLTHLSIVDCNTWLLKYVLDALSLSGDESHILVPRLHILTLKCSQFRKSEDTVRGIIDSRWWPDDELSTHGAARWSRVNLTELSEFSSPQFGIGPELRDKMETLQQSGLDVNIDVASLWDLE
ncbi:F-box domain-containing protein [Favolaschia claudopus]|uniref:F-box domain-containing protein n=1 Tax=Favolaschia claudopus TaxID=2862362 RepID=A0AAW0BYF1_9AGAR